MAISQETRLLNLTTPLGDNVLVLTAFRGHDEMSRLFHYELDMIADKTDIAAADIVGKNVTFSVERADGSRRYFNGFVSEFVAGDLEDDRQNYSAVVVPWLWFLTQTADCRIFQTMTVVQIIEKIFQDLGFSDYEISEVKGAHKTWDYCVQYRETDFNFVSRLMEQEGIFYFFRHEDGKHTLVMADSATAYEDCDEKEVDYPTDVGSQALADHITDWEHRYEFCSGKWAQTDYNFETPKTSLMAKTNSVVDLPGIDKYEVYDYPGEYSETSDGQSETKLRMEEEEVEHDVGSASSLCKTFTPGGKFKIKKHQWPSEEGKTYLITSIHHTATEPAAYETGGAETGAIEDYSNTFTCIPDSDVFRPARITPKPLVSGVQTAVVVGPKGEEIYCDKYGRIKVQFHWDREGKKDENSSCWIRVAHNFAGRKWGFMAIPRIGQEVIIDFLEGDPDRPLIVGSVYNADQMPHYSLPDNQTRTYFKTNSSKGGNGFNELFFEDKKGKERVFMHAQKNMDVRVRNDSKTRVYGNRHQIIGWEKDGQKGGDQKERVYQDKHLNVKRDQVEHIEGNYQLMVGNGEADAGGSMDLVVEKNANLKVGQDGLNLIVEGDRKEKTQGSQSLTVEGGRKEKLASLGQTVDGDCNQKVGNHSLDVGQKQNVKVGMTHALEAGQEVHIKGGMNVVIEAGMQLTLKVGGNFVAIGPAGVDIQGTLVKINSGGAPGSGSGCSPSSPDTPDDPEEADEASPTTPSPAHKEKTGQKSCD